jgi:hypothetical protein
VLRKLVAAIAFLAVAVLPATALGQPHWFRGEETQVTVYVERTRVDATNWSSIKRAGPSGRAAAASGSCTSSVAPPATTA